MKSLRRVLPVVTLLTGLGFAQSIITTIPSPQPIGVDVDPLTRLAYVASFFTPTVQVISEATNTVVDTITFPPGPGGQNPEFSGLAVNPVTSRLYASDPRAGLVYVVAIAPRIRIITAIPVSTPNGIAVNPFTNKIYVSTFFSNSVVIIDGAMNTVTNTVFVPFAEQAAVDLFTNRVYVPSQNFQGQVFVLDGKTDAVLAQVATGNLTTSVGIDFLRHRAYASNQGFTLSTSSLSVIDTNANTVIATIPTDLGPGPVAVDPFTNRIYTATAFQSQNVVDVIDGDAEAIVKRLPIAPNPANAAIDLFHHRLYITSPDFTVPPETNVVTVIDTRP